MLKVEPIANISSLGYKLPKDQKKKKKKKEKKEDFAVVYKKVIDK
jgi:hypothetical protein